MKYKVTKCGSILSMIVNDLDTLLDKLENLTDDYLEVIEGHSWAEINGVGDEYHGDYFSIEILSNY